MNNITIPINGENKIIKSVQHFVIVGANGSGKSHLGALIEKNNPSNVLRISAQRALSISDSITLKNEKTSINKLMYGTENISSKNKGYKWGENEYTTRLINDFDSVLSAIFAKENNQTRAYRDLCKKCECEKTEKPHTSITIIEQIYEIWNCIFPQRELVLDDTSVKAVQNKQSYGGKNMSDGERVALYLIGQCLVAPDNFFVVIDEPEIHLHKSIMYKLWDKIEEKCHTKIFIYITHDLDFAASRKEATKIWVKNYSKENNQEKWDIQVLDNNDDIPDSLMFEVLGNRKPILFVEGERGSYDNQLYPYIYSDYSIIPCHNCSKVIEMTKSFNNEKIKSLHHYNIKGLIDHDYMSEEEIISYKNSNIFTLEVAEVENLYLIEELVKIVAENQALNSDKTLAKVKDFIFEEFKKEFDTQLVSMCVKEVQHKLHCYNTPQQNTLKAMENQLKDLTTSIKLQEIYSRNQLLLNEIITKKNYEKLLRIYNRKSLHKRVSKFLKLSSNEYPNLILRLLKTNKREQIINAIQKYTPNIN